MLSPYWKGFSKENLLRGLVAAVIVATLTLTVLAPLTFLLRADFGSPSESMSPLLIWFF